jgi:predicted membrane channel-forming protein YqfA (hemolysin III family)
MLLTASDIPDWYLHNPHVRTGYRPVDPDVANNLVTGLTHWHNETINIWTHFLGCVGLLVLLIREGRLAIQLYLVGALVVLFMSTGSHALVNHSDRVCVGWLKGDYVGIIVYLGAFMCSMGYLMAPPLSAEDRDGIHLPLALFYAATLAVCLYLVWYVLSPTTDFNNIDGRIQTFALPAGVLMALFVAYAGVEASAHGGRPRDTGEDPGKVLSTWEQPYPSPDGPMPEPEKGTEKNFNPEWERYKELCGWFALLLVLQFCGTALYRNNYPEKMFPGRFDMLGASHQLWHIFCLLVIFGQYAILKDYIRKEEN